VITCISTALRAVQRLWFAGRRLLMASDDEAGRWSLCSAYVVSGQCHWSLTGQYRRLLLLLLLRLLLLA